MKFKILKKSKKSRARLGVIETPHGTIHTPAFVPVATQATVKGITIDQLQQIGVESILCNTYHLYLRPGDELIKKIGGLHKFINWNRPIWTDSGGFQVFSLGAAIEHRVGKIAGIFPEEKQNKRSRKSYRLIRANEPITKHHHEKLTRINEEGVEFRSHLDSSKHLLTPEKSIKIQQNLGADIIFAFDECTSPFHDRQYTKRAMERTHRWAARCLKAVKLKSSEQALFGIIQGGAYEDLRKQSAKLIGSLDFDGFGIGGSLGKSKKDMYKILEWIGPFLPEEKPRHLLGIGSEKDIWEAVNRGIDTFDCVAPTRLGRHGIVLSKDSRMDLKHNKFRNDRNSIDKRCGCYACQNHSRAYLSYLFKANEMLGPILVTIHNLRFMENLMREIREKI
jgi:queuine tRNA-ribosyltransferase/7-cyano-7-deazaguanine tRNA-ribosyltransferase